MHSKKKLVSCYVPKRADGYKNYVNFHRTKTEETLQTIIATDTRQFSNHFPKILYVYHNLMSLTIQSIHKILGIIRDGSCKMLNY